MNIHFSELLSIYNNFFDMYINTTMGIFVLKLVVGILISFIVGKIVIYSIRIIKKTIQKIIKFTKRFFSLNNNIIEEVQREFLAAPLIVQRDFLWIFHIFSLKERERMIFLIKSSVIFLLNSRYLKKNLIVQL